jgi:hypothetical protein
MQHEEQEDFFIEEWILEENAEDDMQQEQNAESSKNAEGSNGNIFHITEGAADAELGESVLELHCSFTRNIYQTCLWLELEHNNQYNKSYTPKHFGWSSLQKIVHQARLKQLHGKNNLAQTEGKEYFLESEVGLSRCYEECRHAEDCDFFAYNTEMMTCVQLGDLSLDDLHQSCGFLMRGTMKGAEVDLKLPMRFSHIAHSMQNFLSQFYIFMDHELSVSHGTADFVRFPSTPLLLHNNLFFHVLTPPSILHTFSFLVLSLFHHNSSSYFVALTKSFRSTLTAPRASMATEWMCQHRDVSPSLRSRRSKHLSSLTAPQAKEANT